MSRPEKTGPLPAACLAQLPAFPGSKARLVAVTKLAMVRPGAMASQGWSKMDMRYSSSIRRRRVGAEADEGQRREGHHRCARLRADLGKRHRQHLRQDVAPHQRRAPHPKRLRRPHEIVPRRPPGQRVRRQREGADPRHPPPSSAPAPASHRRRARRSASVRRCPSRPAAAAPPRTSRSAGPQPCPWRQRSPWRMPVAPAHVWPYRCEGPSPGQPFARRLRIA